MLKIELISIKDLMPYGENARKHTPSDVASIIKSIEQFGMNDPIGIWSDKNIIVEGHGRLMACKELGITEVPCIRLDHLTDEQRRAYALAHNRTAELSDWDFEKLESELASISMDMSEYNFDELMTDELKDLEQKEIEEDDFNVEENLTEKPTAKLGDVYQLGNHRLMCGDSTSHEDVEKLMNGSKADMVVTDPPYNVAYEGKTKDALTIQNDAMSPEQFKAFLTSAFTRIHECLKEGSAFYIWYASREHVNFETSLNDAGLQVRQQLIWVKNAMVLGRQDYQWRHEPCLYGWKDGAPHHWYNDRSQTTILEFNKPTRNGEHPTMKPINLIGYQIQNSCKENEIVVDLFGGSGSTLVACEQLNRKCYTMELDPKYVDVIIKRWETLTGEKAVLLNE